MQTYPFIAFRTVDLHHVVFFSDTRPVELFEMYTTTKKFSKLTKNKGKFEKDGTFELMSKLVVGKILSSEKPRVRILNMENFRPLVLTKFIVSHHGMESK